MPDRRSSKELTACSELMYWSNCDGMLEILGLAASLGGALIEGGGADGEDC